jgi:hypothetical protein
MLLNAVPNLTDDSERFVRDDIAISGDSPLRRNQPHCFLEALLQRIAVLTDGSRTVSEFCIPVFGGTLVPSD